MAGFESALQSASLAILKRELEEDERIEFLELAGAIGMSNVQDYLYMLMIFKRNEDRVSRTMNEYREEMSKRFEEISALERRIDETLESSITKILDTGAQKIGRDLGQSIAKEARNTLTTHEEFYLVRGKVIVAGMVFFLALTAYFLGAKYGFGGKNQRDFLGILLRLPATNVALLCGLGYTAFWSLDYWDNIRADIVYKVKLVLQVAVLIALLIYLI